MQASAQQSPSTFTMQLEKTMKCLEPTPTARGDVSDRFSVEVVSLEFNDLKRKLLYGAVISQKIKMDWDSFIKMAIPQGRNCVFSL